MTDYLQSAADAALRRSITEFGVHLRCGTLRGPVRGYVWQSCGCEDNPVRWPGCDVSRERDLCIVCLRGTAGGVSRYSWLACPNCRTVNDELGSWYGVRPLALGRHSLMNGVPVRGGQAQGATRAQVDRLVSFARGLQWLAEQSKAEFARMAGELDDPGRGQDVPLRVWQQRFAPSPQASKEAFVRLLGDLAR